MTNNLSGFLLGILLAGIDIPGLVTGGNQTITVDPFTRTILIEDKNRFKKQKRLIAFNEIIEVHVSEFGKRSNRTVTYYVSLNLKNGKTYLLFYPAYHEGRWSRMVAECRCEKIAEYLQHQLKKSFN